MKWNMVVGALFISVGLCGQGFSAELLDRMLGLNGCGCTSCCAPKCCEKTCCATEPSCSAPAGCTAAADPSCCAKAADPSCCAAAAPSCGHAAAPSCGCGRAAAAIAAWLQPLLPPAVVLPEESHLLLVRSVRRYPHGCWCHNFGWNSQAAAIAAADATAAVATAAVARAVVRLLRAVRLRLDCTGGG